MMEEINGTILTASDEEEIVPEPEDHISEASKLSSNDDDVPQKIFWALHSDLL